MENPFARLLHRQQSPNDIEGCESHIDPAILDTMTPEGREMVRRVFESSDLVHTVSAVDPSRTAYNEKLNDNNANAAPKPTRSRAEERMIKIFEKRGGRAFRVLRSAETTIKHYKR